MLNETFYLEGVDALSVGIRLQKPIEFSSAVPIVETVSIPGRSGLLTLDTGAYENRAGRASCFLLSQNAINTVSSASNFLLSTHGYRRLECSNDQDHYWLARVKNGARIEDRLSVLNPFEIEFDCMPQKWLKSGETKVSVSNGGKLNNPYGGIASPLIIVYGNGYGKLNVGSYTVTINSMSNVLYLDSETENAYNDNGNQNLNIYSVEFPKLIQGENNISFSGGITKIEIIPRWWDK